METKGDSRGASKLTISYWAFAAIVLVALFAGAALGYLVRTPVAQSCAPEIHSGSQINTSAPSKADLAKYISRCHDVCTATVSVGINVSSGICLDNDINGYACAVVVHDSGHCPAYLRGAPELVFDTKCNYVGTYRAKGGAK